MMDHILHVNEGGHHKKNKTPALHIIMLVSFFVGGISGILGGVAGTVFVPEIFKGLSGISNIQTPPGKQFLKVSEDFATIDVVKKTAPSVVSIIVSKDLSQIYGRTGNNMFPFDNFFDFDFPFQFRRSPQDNGKDAPSQKQQVGGGSGFIISSDGMILTNKHVVGDTEAEYSVIMSDGKEYAAKVLAKDPVNDLAIVKIDAKNLPTLELGDSSGIQIGQTVIAIGNSLGEYSNTVTRGVISGINRVVTAADNAGMTETLQEAIQTDAAINPGNSGGPLLNLVGQVIGINTAINRSGQSIGFALPINTAKRSVDSVKKFGKVIRPWLGVRYVLVDDELAKKNNLSVAYGALIVGNPQKKELSVIPNGPADKAGIKDGDIILELNNERISREHALANAIAQFSAGDEVTLKLLSKGKEKTVKVKLEEFKQSN